ncbi:MAG: FeoB-associated Cys-rich membrane protein [Opitutaceae bacterium]|nr:FeoB-associated Cys-rich membrane protein [Opitutaceae bacterium]
MSPEIQTVAALVVVALAAGWLVRRAFAPRKNPGCGGECGCPTGKLKR